MNSMIDLKVGELFSGAGGLSLGFILAKHPFVNFQPVFAVDNDISSINSYKDSMQWLSSNAPDVLSHVPSVFKRNVEKLNASALLRLLKLERGQLELLIGGPPCQGFSTSNRRGKEKSKSDRNKLINVFLDKVNEFYPKMFLIENVQGVQWTQPTEDMSISPIQTSLFSDFDTGPENVQDYLIHKATHQLGYRVWSNVLNAVDFGVPQYRMRFFLFGVRADLLKEDETVNLSPYLNQLRINNHERVSVLDAIDDLPFLENGQFWAEDNYHPKDNNYIRKMRQYMSNGDLYDHVTTKHADYVIDRYKKIPEGGNWRDIKDELTNYKEINNIHSNIYRRLVGHEPAITISHYRKSMTIHPTQHRGLSFREACRLQSFPDWYRFKGTTNDRQQQLANAVPPLMATAVARAIGEFWSEHISD